MDEYLINDDRINMFNRVLARSEDIDSAEDIMKLFFTKIVPEIEQKIDHPYALFRDYQKTITSERLRELLYFEILLYYSEDYKQYTSFPNKKKLDIFLKLVRGEQSRLSDEYGLLFNRADIIAIVLQDINEEMESLSDLEAQKDFLIKKKVEFTIRQNDDVVHEINNLLYIINEKILNCAVYVDLTRIKEIKEIKDLISPKFDVIKLIELCEELNQAYRTRNFITIPMLIRAIIDHVPPIFNKNNFNEVTSQYGSKSFKDSMTHLDNSLRKIADSLIHNQIRNKETLPSHTQIDFKADLDVLLSEILRILK